MKKTLILSVALLAISANNQLFGIMGRHKLPSQQYRLPAHRINPEAQTKAFKSWRTPPHLNRAKQIIIRESFVESPFSNDEQRFNGLMTILMPHFGALNNKDRQHLRESCSYMASHLNEADIAREAFVESSFSNGEDRFNKMMTVLEPHLDKLEDKDKRQLRLTCRYMASHVADDKLKKVQPWIKGEKVWNSMKDNGDFLMAEKYTILLDSVPMLSRLLGANVPYVDSPNFYEVDEATYTDGTSEKINEYQVICDQEVITLSALPKHKWRLYIDNSKCVKYAVRKNSPQCFSWLVEKDPFKVNNFYCTSMGYSCGSKRHYGPLMFDIAQSLQYSTSIPQEQKSAMIDFCKKNGCKSPEEFRINSEQQINKDVASNTPDNTCSLF